MKNISIYRRKVKILRGLVVIFQEEVSFIISKIIIPFSYVLQCYLYKYFLNRPSFKKKNIHVISAERYSMLDIGLLNDWSCAVRIQRTPAAFSWPSIHLVGGLLAHLPVSSRHPRKPMTPSTICLTSNVPSPLALKFIYIFIGLCRSEWFFYG